MSTEELGADVPEVHDDPQPLPSLADHRAEFPSPPKPGEPLPSDDAPAPRAARRAQSHVAKAKDVPEIAALTKELREAEEKIQVERKPGESDRVYQLRKRAAIAKLAVAPPAPVVETRATPPPVAQRPPAAPSEFTEKEPTLEDFAKEADPYGALQRALARYDRKKEAFDAQQETAKTTYKAQEETFYKEINDGIGQHVQRVVAFQKANPDAKALMEAEAAKPLADQIQLTLAVRGAIEFHEKGPEMVLALLQHPELADELFLLTTGRPVGDPRTDSLVATVRRRLLQRISGVTSGAPNPPSPRKLAPRPPTPERTVPQTPREPSSSDAPGSIADHRSRFPAQH